MSWPSGNVSKCHSRLVRDWSYSISLIDSSTRPVCVLSWVVVLKAAASPQAAYRYLFACRGLGSASAALCLEPSAWASLFLARPQHVLEISAPILLEAHELVTFQGSVVHLVHIVNEFSVSTVVGGRHYYCTIYWFYVSSTFCFSHISIFQATVSICLASLLGWLHGTDSRLLLTANFKVTWHKN